MTVTVGSSAPLSLSPGGAAATLVVTLPTGATLVPNPTVTATVDAFTATLDTTIPGRHLLSWYVPAEDAYFVDILDVWPADPRYIISIADALDQVAAGANTPQATKDAMPIYVATATYVIERLAGPVLVATRTKVVDGGRSEIVLPATNVTVTSVTVGGATLAPSAYRVDSEAGIVRALSGAFTCGVLNVSVSYQVGASIVPENLQLAARELVRHLWQSSRQGGSSRRPEAAADTVATPFGFAVPKRVVELCESVQTAPAPGFA